MIKRLNKKGEQASDNFIPLIIGILVLLVVSYFVYKFYSEGSQIADKVPDNIEKTLQACDVVLKASSTDPSTFCRYFQEFEIDNKKYSYHCNDLAQLAAAKPDWYVDSENLCNGYDDLERKQCLSLRLKGDIDLRETVYVTRSARSCEYNATGLFFEKTMIADANGVQIEEGTPLAGGPSDKALEETASIA